MYLSIKRKDALKISWLMFGSVGIILKSRELNKESFISDWSTQDRYNWST